MCWQRSGPLPKTWKSDIFFTLGMTEMLWSQSPPPPPNPAMTPSSTLCQGCSCLEPASSKHHRNKVDRHYSQALSIFRFILPPRTCRTSLPTHETSRLRIFCVHEKKRQEELKLYIEPNRVSGKSQISLLTYKVNNGFSRKNSDSAVAAVV